MAENYLRRRQRGGPGFSSDLSSDQEEFEEEEDGDIDLVEEENFAEIEEDDGLSDDEVPALEEVPQDQFFDAANFPHLREELELVENIGVNMQY